MIRKTVRKKRTLGSAQRKVLSYLATNGTWWPECGWTYDSASATDHVLRTLSVHGLAKRVNSIGSKLGTYEITSLGRETMKALEIIRSTSVDDLPKRGSGKGYEDWLPGRKE